MYKMILLPVDLDQKSSWEKAAPVAVTLARQYGITIHVLTVIPEYKAVTFSSFLPKDFSNNTTMAAREWLDKFTAEHIPQELLAGSSVVLGTIYKRILINADELGCDLVVMSSHQPEKADYLIGPNAARVVRHAKQSVFVVR
jgi:nucleotide-binding universal stress UspA family protein